MLGYPKKPVGGIRKASKKHSREDEANAPTDYMEAYHYWSKLSATYARTGKYYWEVSGWWLKVAGVFIAISVLAQVVSLICLVGS